jgi:hypothetical protein
MLVITRRALAFAGTACLALTTAASIAAPAAHAASSSAKPSWRISALLHENRYSTLLTLTALSRHDAWTFGQSSKGHGTAAHWNGSAWSLSAFPGPFRPSSVSATGARNVWASGTECTGGGPGIKDITGGYVARYNGHSWTSTRFKSTAYCRASVVTTGPRNGWLLGNGKAEHFTGGHWRQVSNAALGQVLAATAVSAHNIWTVSGNFNEQHLSRSHVFFAHYSGRTWRDVAMPAIKLPTHGYLYPFDIEAASAHSIWAAVTVEPAASRSYLLHFNGSKWTSIPLPARPDQMLQVVPDGASGVWAIMFQSDNGNYEFAHYSGGKWSYDAVPTAGLPGLSGTAVFDVYAMARIPGTQVMMATGDVFYSTAANKSRQYSLSFRYGS